MSGYISCQEKTYSLRSGARADEGISLRSRLVYSIQLSGFHACLVLAVGIAVIFPGDNKLLLLPVQPFSAF